jgi:hypothetical protein
MDTQDLLLILNNQHAILVALSRLDIPAAAYDLEHQKEETRKRIMELWTKK